MEPPAIIAFSPAALAAVQPAMAASSPEATLATAQLTITSAQSTASSAQSGPNSGYPVFATMSPPFAAPVCYFTHKLSAEIRIHIYKFVFGPGERAQRTRVALVAEEDDKDEDDEDEDAARIDIDWIPGIIDNIPPKQLQPLHTDILAVNKLIHKESLEALYNNKVISVTFSQYDQLLQLNYPRELIRNVEIVCCNSGIYSTPYIHKLLDDVPTLPRLKTFTIRSDCLARTADPAAHTTVRQFAYRYHLGDVLCTDIGTYNLREFPKVTIAHEKIVRMWPNVANTPDDYDALKEAWNLATNETLIAYLPNIMAWVSHHSLRLWVGLLQKYFDRKIEGIKIDEDEDEEDEASLKERRMLEAFRVVSVGDLFAPPDLPICKLTSHHDKYTLEHITEMLSMNIQTYYAYVEGQEGFRQPRWVELGHESELHRQGTYQAKLKQTKSEQGSDGY